MRVGFFTEVYRPVQNGVVVSVDALARGLRALGHEVQCFAPHMPGSSEADGSLRMPSLPLPISTPYRLTLPLVNRHNRHAILNRLHVLHAHSPFVTGWMSVRYARRLRIPLVYTYHTRLEEYVHYFPVDAKAARYAASTLTRTFANQADSVIVPTPAMARRLRELGVTVHLEVVPSGIETEHFSAGKRREDLRASFGTKANERLLLFVGRLAREKNVDILLEALAYAKTPARLVIAGDGPELQTLQAKACALRIDSRTVFLGAVSHAELPDLYATADAFVFPSVTETQGLVVAEALAAGALVIAADSPAMRDVLESAGLLVEPSASSFAAAFAQIPQTADSGRAQAAKTSAERFAAARQATKVAALYERLIAERLATAGTP